MKKLFFILLLTGFLASCQTTKGPIFETEKILDSKYGNFEMEKIDLDYQANCRISGKRSWEQKAASGKCTVLLTQDGKMHLQVLDPFSSPVTDIFMDSQEIQVLYRRQKIYQEMENNEENRKSAFWGMDLTVQNLQSIVWGRKVTAVPNDIQFEFKEDKPKFLIKSEGEQQIIKINIRKWLEYKGYFFPKLLKIRDQEGNRLTLAITEFRLGHVADKVEKLAIPDGYQQQ